MKLKGLVEYGPSTKIDGELVTIRRLCRSQSYGIKGNTILICQEPGFQFSGNNIENKTNL